MGEPTNQPASIIHHFSHPHPLQLSHSHSPLRLFPVICSCCNQTVSGWIYACNSCKYFIHVSCCQMPQNITHPFDQNHVPIQASQAQHYPTSPTPVPIYPSAGNPILQAPQAQHYPASPTSAVPMYQSAGNPILQATQAQHYPASPTSAVPMYQSAGNPILQVPQAQHYPASPTSALPMYQSAGNPILQAPQAQHYPTLLTPAVPAYQYTGDPMALCPPYKSTGPPLACVPRPPMQYHVPSNTVNLTGPVAFASGLLGMIAPGVITGACQTLMQGLLDGTFLGS